MVLVFEDDAQRISRKRYYIPNFEIKDYNFMIDEYKNMKILEKILFFKDMIIELVVYETIPISKNT